MISVGATLVGCSSAPAPAPLPPGALVAGTAHVTVNGNDLGEFHSGRRHQFGEDLLTISTGNGEQGSTAVVSNAVGLTAKSVAINDLGGFTGSYNEAFPAMRKCPWTGRRTRSPAPSTASTPTSPASVQRGIQHQGGMLTCTSASAEFRNSAFAAPEAHPYFSVRPDGHRRARQKEKHG